MVCQFLLYNKVNQLYVYIYPHIPSLLRLPPTLPIPPLQVVTKHRADLPVLCGCFPLAIYFTFGSVYMPMPLSHFVPAYPFPAQCPQVHSLCVHLYYCPAPRFFRTIFLQIPYTCVSCLTDSRSIHLTTNNSISLLFMANIPLYICATSSLSIHLSMGTQGCSHVLATVNSAAMNTVVYICF